MARRATSEPDAFVRAIELLRERVASVEQYPFTIPAIRTLDTLALHPQVTFLVGENGSGKSTLIEAIAAAAGFNAEGGSKNFSFATRSESSVLAGALRLVRGMRRERDGFFLRAESFYNAATYIDETGATGYGDRSLHAQSHGESFLALANHRFRGDGLYLLDEPEAALSPSRQLSLLQIIDQLVRQRGSQLVIATHSPILMAYPRATIYALGADGIAPIAYEDTEHYVLTRDFLANPARFFRHLFDE